MPSADLLKEAERVMGICNACRYCEGFCAVFPAIELRRTFTDQDLKYLANLCHNCRNCYYACQYAPPHEFAMNVPKSLAELRLDTYKEFGWPTSFTGLFRRNGLAVSLITALSVTMVLMLTLVFQGSSVVFTTHLGENGFYAVNPYLLIVLPMSALVCVSNTLMAVATGAIIRTIGSAWLGGGSTIWCFTVSCSVWLPQPSLQYMTTSWTGAHLTRF